MSEAEERLRPHNSTLFRLGCLRFTIRYTGDCSTLDLIKSFQCNAALLKLTWNAVQCFCIKLLLLCTAVSKFLSVYFQLKCIYDTLEPVYHKCVYAVHATFGPLSSRAGADNGIRRYCASLPPSEQPPQHTAMQCQESTAAEVEVPRKWPRPPTSGSSHSP